MYNPFSLNGKTILVTGASSGIGKSAAIECAKMGAICIITGRNEKRLNDTLMLLEGNGHRAFPADLTIEEDLNRLVEQCPSIDGLINNAGIGYTKLIAFYKESNLRKIYETNAFAPMLLTSCLIKKKKINTGASVVFTSSIAAITSYPGNGIYGTAKASLASFALYCAREFACKKIRVNTIMPGMVDTSFIHEGALSEEELKADMVKYPLQRYGTPEEIAYLMIYLLSDAAAWITGQSFIIDGGITLK
ncbi:MAG: SDR family oxidoreductase [Paludibacteraceae bacterium]|nr:SDR family oxidoreductase [Paludibacteraceae bacterium]